MTSTPLSSASESYNVARWGDGFFTINAEGQLCVRPGGAIEGEVEGKAGGEASLQAVLDACKQSGLRVPVLARFSGILRQRVKVLAAAFRHAIAANQYAGGYTPVYPIKVNQQRRVVSELLKTRDEGERIGLEAGSKPELLAVLALSRPGDTIVCNGYKDEEYLRLALMGEKLGFHVYIVVEKMSELPLLLSLAEQLQVTPRIGLRVRLMSVSKGKWQNSGGEKSKFGLSASQLLNALALCREAEKLDCVRLLHFHLGSQVANLSDIKNGMQEAARYYTQMREAGAAIDVLDVGGGLGVDYEGTHSRSFCSMNYEVADYAAAIVGELKSACATAQVPEPAIISESGRALTAHHAVLLTNITDQERYQAQNVVADDPALQPLMALQNKLENAPVSLLEIHAEVGAAWARIHEAFLAGEVSLTTRATAEKVYINCLLLLRDKLDPARKLQRELLDQLRETLADKLFVNFSVFQSVPDVWGIEQIFPILPLSGLDKPATRRAILQDITCDSDGRIDQFVDGEGVEATLPLPEEFGQHLGIFMVGAYQEILGDMHNLFGDTDSVDVEVSSTGEVSLAHAIQGDTVSKVLHYVNFESSKLLATLEEHCHHASITERERGDFLQWVNDGLSGYTYLE